MHHRITGSMLPPELFAGEIEAFLPSCQSWSDDALMFGVEDSHTIQIWKREGITFRFDLRKPDMGLLRSIVDFARLHELLMVPDTRGQRMEPSLDDIIADIRTSDSFSFCKDPEAYLKGLKHRRASEPASGGNR